MVPGKYDISVYQGDTLQFSFAVYADEANPTPDNVTASQFKMQVRKDGTRTSTLLLERTSATAGHFTHLDGWVYVNATATEMAALKAGEWYYDIEQTTGAVVLTLLSGRFIILDEVTFNG